MTRTRIAIFAAAALASCAAATQASALRNQYTDESPPGILPWVFGTAGYYDPDDAYERPIRRPYRPHGRYPDAYGEPVPPPPFYDGVD